MSCQCRVCVYCVIKKQHGSTIAVVEFVKSRFVILIRAMDGVIFISEMIDNLQSNVGHLYYFIITVATLIGMIEPVLPSASHVSMMKGIISVVMTWETSNSDMTIHATLNYGGKYQSLPEMKNIP